MTKKRLTRELKWGFQGFPYHQLWMDNDIYTGWVAINYLTDGKYYYWEYPKSGKVPVAGKGMCWLTLIPEGKSRSITAKFTEERRVSVWYTDVIDKVTIDEDGVVAFIDKYLDVIFTPSGDVVIDDKDELDNAYHSGELTKEQYETALQEGDSIVEDLCQDIAATEKWCLNILHKAEEIINQNPFTIFLDIDGVLDIFHSNLYYQELIPEALERFAKLVHRTKAKVVVVSDWRYGSKECERSTDMLRDNWKQLEEKLKSHGVEISDVTTCESTYKNRTEEIRAYLLEHPEIKKYAILDDCFSDDYSSDTEIKRHLVFVDALKGLQDENCIQVCGLMNEII
ncbi:MAG: DUF402 domain-containing protein [Lachnospiraceae bacterium]|nr:DUF402 domain-containing protein [Lachnospiraceae bacterium]